ncbi:MAG: GNAT family N-acetyltransferase [Candidatus Thorarchaeota archaeon]
MIHVEIDNVNSEDYQKLAKLMIDTRKGTVLESTKSMQEIVESIKTLAANDAFRMLIARNEQGDIVGWTYYYIAIPLMSFISGFFPIVDKTEDMDSIAVSLIEAGKQEILERNHTRLEIELELHTDAHRSLSESLVDWYKKAGFKFAAEEMHMSADLTSVELPHLELPSDYILKEFSDVPIDLLIHSGYEIFNDSMEDLFRSMSHEEKRVNLEYWFDKSKPFHDGASLVLMEEEKIIGFIIAKPDDDEIEIGPVGIIRKARGQRLGTILLGTVLRTLKEEGVEIVSLDTSLSNSLSQNLYTKYGFKPAYHKQFYYWST